MSNTAGSHLILSQISSPSASLVNPLPSLLEHIIAVTATVVFFAWIITVLGLEIVSAMPIIKLFSALSPLSRFLVQSLHIGPFGASCSIPVPLHSLCLLSHSDSAFLLSTLFYLPPTYLLSTSFFLIFNGFL